MSLLAELKRGNVIRKRAGDPASPEPEQSA